MWLPAGNWSPRLLSRLTSPLLHPQATSLFPGPAPAASFYPQADYVAGGITSPTRCPRPDPRNYDCSLHDNGSSAV